MSYLKKIATPISNSSQSIVSISSIDYGNLSPKDASTFYVVDTTAPSSTSVTGVLISKASTTIQIGNTETLSATVAPSNATNKAVIWS